MLTEVKVKFAERRFGKIEQKMVNSNVKETEKNPISKRFPRNTMESLNHQISIRFHKFSR